MYLFFKVGFNDQNNEIKRTNPNKDTSQFFSALCRTVDHSKTSEDKQTGNNAVDSL